MSESMNWKPTIAAFLCNWCSYAGADLAGTGRQQYPPHIRVIRVPCTGRVDPLYIIKALVSGADGVMVLGCHPGDCHYLKGNLYARRRFAVLKKLLTAVGVEPGRVHFAWVSASEGARFAEIARNVAAAVSALGPNRFEAKSEKKETRDPAKTPFPRLPSAETAKRFENQEEKLREMCASLLSSGEVASVLGFGNPSGGGSDVAPPVVVKKAENVRRLAWNDRCLPALAPYLTRLMNNGIKTAVVAKPCDARAIANLAVEKQLDRQQIHVIGMECDGMAGSPACQECETRVSPISDSEIPLTPCEAGPSTSWNAQGTAAAPESDDEDISSARFRAETEKCILCFSCRQACYGCYCETCFMDRETAASVAPDLASKMMFHLGRTMHLAGRCVECGACENACASGVNVRYLIRVLTAFVKKEYGYRTGMDADHQPALLCWNPEDGEPGFLGHEEG